MSDWFLDSELSICFKDIVVTQLTQQWHLNKIDHSVLSVPLLATFLDPRFKDTNFLTVHRNHYFKRKSSTLLIAVTVTLLLVPVTKLVLNRVPHITYLP